MDIGKPRAEEVDFKSTRIHVKFYQLRALGKPGEVVLPKKGH